MLSLLFTSGFKSCPFLKWFHLTTGQIDGEKRIPVGDQIQEVSLAVQGYLSVSLSPLLRERIMSMRLKKQQVSQADLARTIGPSHTCVSPPLSSGFSHRSCR